MSEFNAGLPRKTPVAGAIGDTKLMWSKSFLHVDGAGSTWLRRGVAMPASDYPEAAKIPELQIFTGTAIALPTGTPYRGMATNGKGAIVIALTSGANVLRSGDYGATWSLVAHGLGSGTCDTVVWHPGEDRFLVFAGSAGAIHGARSTTSDGSAFAAAFQTSTSVSVGQPGSARAVISPTTGTVLVAFAQDTQAVHTLPQGSNVFTARAIPLLMNSRPSLAVKPDGTFYCAKSNASASLMKSVNDGATFATTGGAVPSSYDGRGDMTYFKGKFIFCSMAGGTANIYYGASDTTLAPDWSLAKLPSGVVSNPTFDVRFTFAFDRIHVPLSGGSTFTTLADSLDGIMWTERQRPFTNADVSGWYTLDAGNGMPLFLWATLAGTIPTNVVYRCPSYVSSDYIGNITGVVGVDQLFTRIKR